jgi:transposase
MTGRQLPSTRARDTEPARRRRVTQETIDQMAALRRQGFSFREIGKRVGCSERTARRYAGTVEPQLRLPPATVEPEADPRELREQLVTEFIQFLHRDPRLQSLTVVWHQVGESHWTAEYGGPPSILFLSEAERLFRERLDRTGVIALRLLALDGRSKRRFIREVVGYLYRDYVSWHELAQRFDTGDETGEDWLPPSARPEPEPLDDDMHNPRRLHG